MKLFKKENVEFQKALELSDKEESERLSVYKSDGEAVEDKDSCNKLKECETYYFNNFYLIFLIFF
jgi:hypothetical protein